MLNKQVNPSNSRLESPIENQFQAELRDDISFTLEDVVWYTAGDFRPIFVIENNILKMGTFLKSNETISIKKIKNDYLLENYNEKRCQKQNIYPNLREEILFHGTSQNRAELICRNNLDWRRAKSLNGGFGCYFCEYPKYATSFPIECNAAEKNIIVFKIHKLMLKDVTRNKAYHDAIFNNREDIVGKIVLDVGAGTGILSVFCAQAGAKKVYAVEASETYKIAMEVSKENGFENVVQVIHSKIEDVTSADIPEKVDAIVSEWMGFYLLHEAMLDSVIIARDRFLKSNGMIFPESAAIYASPCSVPSMFNDWESVNGVKMRCFANLLRNQACKKPLTEVVSPEAILCEPEVVSWIDLREVTVEELNEISFRHVAVSKKEASYEGICLWFSCTFPFPKGPNNFEPVTLSTEPEEPETHWKQTVIVLPTAISVEIGSPICYDLVMKKSTENSRRYTLEVTMLDPEEVEHPEYCSCFMTKCILVRAVLEKYERGEGDGSCE